MRGMVRFLVLVFISVFMAFGQGYADSHGDNGNPAYREGEILVKFRPGVPGAAKSDAHARAGAETIREFPGLRMQHVRLRNGQGVEAAIAVYEKNPNVEYAEPNYIVSTDAFPNDPQFNNLWGLHNTGQTGGTVDADIDAPEAWDITTGLVNTVVAVIDTGIDYTHEDLAQNIWVNQTEYAGTAGIDDDGNGYIDDIHGIDTCNYDADPMDDAGHGTHVAGTIGAVGDNGIGVTGINRDIGMLACKFLDSYGYGDTAGAIECLEYVSALITSGVNIVATNNSWGSYSYSQSLKDAIDAQRDILFVAAAGNDWTDNDVTPHYPSSYYLPNVVAVTATNHNDGRAYNFGRRSVHAGAPGYAITSTIPGNQYSSYYGTSMATPHVTGVAALIKAQDGNRDWRAIRNLILAGGDGISSLEGVTITGKRLNASGSLTCLDSPVFSALKYPSPEEIGLPATLSALSINCSAPAGPVTVTDPFGADIELYDDGIAPDLAAGDGMFTGVWTSSADSGRIIFSSPSGTESLAPFFRIETSAMPEADTHVYYSNFVQAAGGIEPYTWSLASGSLPDGLSLDGMTGEISGTPTATGWNSFTVRVVDAESSVIEKFLSIDVVDDPVVGLWHRVYDGGSDDDAYDVAVDVGGNVYVTGSVMNMTLDALTIKYDSSGNVVWSRVYDAGLDEDGQGIAVDAGGNAYVAGSSISSAGATSDFLVIKYDPDGNMLWTRNYDHGDRDYAYGIAVDESAAPGGLLVTGDTQTFVSDVLTVKYDLSGNFIWAKTTDVATFDNATDIAVDGGGNFFVSAYFYNGSNDDMLLIKYDPSGTVLWTRTYDGGNYDNAYAVAVDAAGNTYITGGSLDGFLTFKYDPSGTVLWSRAYHESFRETPYSVAVDGSGNVYVTGFSTPDGVNNDILTIGYDPSGSLLWERKSDFGGSESAYGIAVNGDGDFHLAGHSYNGSDWDFLALKYTVVVDIITPPLPKAYLATFYSEGLTAVGGVTPYTWSVISGSLPDGLTLDSQTGEISGTPTALGTFNFVMQVQDAQVSVATKAYSISVQQFVSLVWDRTADRGFNDYGRDAAADMEGNVYVTGESYNGADSDYLTLKYDPSGNILWSMAHDGGGNDYAKGAAVDSEGNVYVAGHTFNGSDYDILTVKYDPFGQVLMTRVFDDGGHEYAFGIAVDGGGNFYVTGRNRYGDWLTIKYGSSGAVVWTAVHDGGSMNTNGNGIAVDEDGFVYVAGISFNGTDYDWRTIKYDQAGNEVWVRDYAGAGWDAARDVSVDGSGNVYVTGNLHNGANDDYCTVKYDPSGTLLWAKIIDRGSNDYAESIAVDESGYVYVTGNSQGGSYTVKYDPAGNEIWTDAYASGSAYGVALDSSRNVYIAGYLYSAQYDFFLAKYWQKFPLEITTTALEDGNVNVAYSRFLEAFGGMPPYAWAVTVGSLPPGLALNAATGEISGIPAATGSYGFSVQVTDANTDTASTALSITVNELNIATSSLPYGTVGTGYSQALSATGGLTPYTWAVTAGTLPPGLSLDSGTGVISGTPASAGVSSFTVQVTDANSATATGDFSITVYEPLNVTTTALPFGVAGTAYSEGLSATGGLAPYTWAVTSGTLPAGLTLDSATGMISGTPTEAGVSNFTVQATDANGETDSQALSMDIYEPVVVSTTSLSYGVTGRSYSQTLAATGGLAPYSWAVTAGALPDGLSLDGGTGVISGTPTTLGTSSFTVQVTDANGETGSQALSIAVYEPLSAATASLPDGVVGNMYSQSLAATGGLAPYSWAITAGALPVGLTLEGATGVISGIPSVAGVFSFTAEVTDANGETASSALSITIGTTTTYYIYTASGCGGETYSRGPQYALLGTASGDCSMEDVISWKFKGTPRDMLIGYLANGGYATDTQVVGSSTGNSLSFLISGSVGTGYVHLAEIDPLDGTVLQVLSSLMVQISADTLTFVTDISALSGTVRAGNTVGMVLSMSSTSRAPNEIRWGKTDGGPGLEQWFTVTETPAGP